MVTHILTKTKDFIGKSIQVESSKGREPRTGLLCGSQSLGFMIMGLVPGLSLAVHLSWPMFGLIQGPPPGGVHVFQPRWILKRRGGW